MGGDLLFLVSCTEIVSQSVSDQYKKTLVLHASDLPRGRGWSPHIWSILDGSDEITVSLLEAAEPVDSGDIWAKKTIVLEGTELYDEINDRLFDAEIELMEWAIDHFSDVTPVRQDGEPTYLRRRTPEDSWIDATRPLDEQFDLLRVADPVRFPAIVELRGKKFRLRLDRID